MPSQAEVKWSQLKVGLLVFASLALLMTLLFLMTSASGMSVFSHKITAYAYFGNSNGVKPGAAVNLEGVTIGEVKHVIVTNDPERKLTPVEVVMKIDPKFERDLHTDTRAALSTVGVLGDTIVDLNSKAATGPVFQDGSEFRTANLPTIQDVVQSSEGTIQGVNLILAKVNTLVDNLQKGRGSAGKLLTDDALYDRASATLAQLQTLATNLNSTHGTAGKLLNDPSLYNHLDDAATRLDTLTTGLSTGKGSAGKLLTDDALYNNLNTTLTSANALLAQVNSGKGTLGELVKDPAIGNKLNDTLTQLDTLLSGVNAGKGTLGQLATNDAAYKHLDALLTNSDQLVTMFRQDPKKYLTIHMKIF